MEITFANDVIIIGHSGLAITIPLRFKKIKKEAWHHTVFCQVLLVYNKTRRYNGREQKIQINVKKLKS